MINWYDIQVEQEIAQERYEPLIQARQFERRSQSATGPERTVIGQTRNWLGDQLQSWGCRVKVVCEPA
jgi:hypothetical protein